MTGAHFDANFMLKCAKIMLDLSKEQKEHYGLEDRDIKEAHSMLKYIYYVGTTAQIELRPYRHSNDPNRNDYNIPRKKEQ